MSMCLGLFSFESKLTLYLNPKIFITAMNIVAETVNTTNNNFPFQIFCAFGKTCKWKQEFNSVAIYYESSAA
jgi:hypothetical protein